MTRLIFDRHTIEISNTKKVYFPGSNITKGDLVNYYKDIAEIMIPHLMNRPVSMLRMPNGIEGEIFFQKDASNYFPKWIKLKKIKKKEGGTVKHVLINNKATLIYLANQACVTPHVWLSRADKLNFPDRLIFDLDPPDENNFRSVKEAAKIFREYFTKELELPLFLMTTGSRGLHIVLPLIRKYDFDFVRKFAQDSAKVLAERHPKKLTIEVRKNKREGRIFLDTARNAYAQTSVPPYSVRPIEGAPVAAPIEWDELDDKKLSPQKYNIKNIFRKLEKQDPWIDMHKNKISLSSARKILDDILNTG